MDTKQTPFPVLVYTSNDDKRNNIPTYMADVVHLEAVQVEGKAMFLSVVRILKVYKYQEGTPAHWHCIDGLQTFFISSLVVIRESSDRYAEYLAAKELKRNDASLMPKNNDQYEERPKRRLFR